MTDLAHDTELQTMTAVGKVMVIDNSTALLLGLLGFSATKLWNAAEWHTEKYGMKPVKYQAISDLDVAIKLSRPRRLHSQSAQAIPEELWQSYKSWFGLRKAKYGKPNHRF